ncbi:hypothetical protein [Streptomyces sp. Act143]|uniref:hypothetical protein n=1 Tax=Streptomyces sp. Act143 TaxID=2200760 RepID=UPI0015E820D0|nr:hypothetical protein [Streptomyces sp. Act143]
MQSAQLPTPDPKDDRPGSDARPQDASVPAAEAPVPEGSADVRGGTISTDEDTEYEPL